MSSTRRLRRRGQVASGLGAIGVVTAVGIAGTVTAAQAAEPVDVVPDPPPVTGALPVVPQEVARHRATERPLADRSPAEQSYTVRAGDTVSGIAARYGTTVAAIVAANDLGPVALIRIGQVLVIPAGGTGAAAPAPVAGGAGTHTVRSGDTLSGIAAAHGTTVARIMALNALTSDVIRPGQQLRVTGPTTATAAGGGTATASGTRYTVRSGDTVSAIAARHGTSVAAIVAANDLGAHALIRIGQVLVLPGGGVTATAAAPAADEGASTAGTYAVVRGDTLSGIAARHGTTVGALAALNDLTSDVIHPGQQLRVPGSADDADDAADDAPAAPTSTAPTSATSTATSTYTVSAGDTLSGIASRHGTTVAQLTSLNDLPSTVIRPGQQLRVPTQLVPSTFLGYTYPDAVVAAANANKHTLLSTDLPGPADVQEIIRSTALDMGVDPALALAVAHQESGFSAAAVSPANAIGAMQVIPSSGEWASGMVGRDLDLLDPHDNAVAGVAILRWLLRNAEDLPTAIAGYYQGLGSVRSNGMYADTRRYVAGVQTLMTRYG